MGLTRLRKKLEDALTQSSAQASGQRREQRQRFIERAYAVGGAEVVERVQRFGATEKGDPIRLSQWYAEYLELISDFRWGHTLTTGPSQIGKTLGHTLVMVDSLVFGKLNVAWFYDTRTNLEQNVPLQFRPVVHHWLAQMMAAGIPVRRQSDSATITRFQIDQANGIFSYVSTSTPTRRDREGAAAGSAAISFQADWLVMEERSQYPAGAADALPRRLDASMLPSRPIREVGTPGGGQGIELGLRSLDHYFYPHVQCPSCEAMIRLDPKGCLLQAFESRDLLGVPRLSYLSESGRPVQWFHRDPSSPVETAYIGCSACGEELTDKAIRDAHFRCTMTGLSAREVIDALPSGIPELQRRIAIHLSPLTRQAHNVAPTIIRAGIEAVLTRDWQQQGLGHPSETDINSVTLDMIRRAMAAPTPTGIPDYTLCGIDVGRSEDWIAVVDFFLPQERGQLAAAQIMEQTIRRVRLAQGIGRGGILGLLANEGVGYGLIDNEPSRESSMNLCRDSPLEMVNQVNMREVVRKTIVRDGGIESECWDIRNERFLGAVLEGFLLQAEDGGTLYRLPADWDQWIGSPSEHSPLVHLMGPSRSPEGQWRRGKNNVDHLYMALSFCEAAFYIQMCELVAGNFSFGGITQDRQTKSYYS